MYHQKIIIFVILFRCYCTSANENNGCDCDILQLNYSEDPDSYDNFTIQSGKIHGRPYYFSMQRDIIWWNKQDNRWSISAHKEIDGQPFFLPTYKITSNASSLCSENNEDWTFLRSDDKVIKSKCFMGQKCSAFQGATNYYSVLFNDNKNNIAHEGICKPGNLTKECRSLFDSQDDNLKFEGTRRGQCKFPFRYNNTEYNTCTMEDSEKLWCGTAVYTNGTQRAWGYCIECENSWFITIAISSASVFVFFLALLSFFLYWKRKKGKKVIQSSETMVLNLQAEQLSYTGKHEIDQSKFEIGRKLGAGSFGNVHEGTTEDLIHPGKNIKVAIKSVNNPLDPSQIYALMCEIKVLDKLEMNLNLVNMIGACTTEFKSGKIWLLLEYCPHGDMKSFLLRNRDIISQGLHYQRVPHEIMNIRLFLKWSHGICKGMEYLASKNIMHGDLAARNILITSYNDENYLAKIADFGLSKTFYDKTSYEKQDRKQLPWKWMDVDYYETGVFKLSSDVWSFGVVFWEMLSMGRVPYPEENANDTIPKIKAGLRLQFPDEVKEANWLAKSYNEVTEMCWQLDPNKRCNFSDLVKTFETLLTFEEKEKYKMLEKNIIKYEGKHETSNEAISFNNLQDNVSAESMNDIETVYSNPTDEVIDLEYVDPVVEVTF